MKHNRKFKVIQVLFSFLTLVIFFTLLSCKNNYDIFFNYDLTLQSNQKRFSIDEKIIMTATIVPKEADIVRLYKERSKSFEILVRSTEGVQVTPKNKSHVYSHKSATDEEGIDSIEISPVNPFSMKIVGRIRRNKSGGIFFDFGKFGCFSADGFGDFYIWGHWEPVDPHWSDALEDYTSGVDVTIQSSETKN